jgi:hypothetical protein
VTKIDTAPLLLKIGVEDEDAFLLQWPGIDAPVPTE